MKWCICCNFMHFSFNKKGRSILRSFLMEFDSFCIRSNGFGFPNLECTSPYKIIIFFWYSFAWQVNRLASFSNNITWNFIRKKREYFLLSFPKKSPLSFFFPFLVATLLWIPRRSLRENNFVFLWRLIVRLRCARCPVLGF